MTPEPPFMTALRAAFTLAFLYFGLRKLGSLSTDVAIHEAIGFGQFHATSPDRSHGPTARN
jgi:hypothetical protein